ncbi:hypothetical protein HMPREF9296_1414 [Prevotella disiens FB035-09AN]|uniref:Uncharacterized protein n=1 Tax=Prevotella disiens FB035-09AN TaxID=866771 RepID=E1KRV5_9BACT|nr:hypothetical protein HMPREF9296_1414 [Prevotella disiens FB035-09AN]
MCTRKKDVEKLSCGFEGVINLFSLQKRLKIEQKCSKIVKKK